MSGLLGLFTRVGGGEVIIIVVVLLLLFGARKLPELARAVGRSAKELRKGLSDDEDKEDDGN